MKKSFPAWVVLSLLCLLCARAMAQGPAAAEPSAEPASASAASAPASSASQASSAAEPASQAAVSTRPIALAPIFPSQTYSADNRAARVGFALLMSPLASAVAMDSESNKRARIRNLVETELKLHKELMDALKAEFKSSNQELFDLESPKYYRGEPENLDFRSSESASDWILTANIFDVGVSYGFFAGKHVPKLNVTFYLTNRHTEETAYDMSIYYGADAKKATPDQIPVDPSLGFENFGEILGSRKEDFVQALRSGVSALAKAVAVQVGQLKLDAKKP